MMMRLFCVFFLLSQCVFAESSCNDEEYSRVYLASFPRSGNHWVRYLVEEATHIATSSVYPDRDPPHLPRTFPWKAYCADHGYEGNCRYPHEGESVLVKTHFPVFLGQNPAQYTKVIRIVRHPIDSFYSFFLYQNKSNNLCSVPVNSYIILWKKFQNYWNAEENVFTFRYEDLLDNPEFYLKQILEIVGYSVTDEDIHRAVLKYPPMGHMLKSLDHFTKEERFQIRSKLSQELKQFGYTIPD